MAAQKPAVELAKDRVVDRMRPDGSAVEVKSGAGELSPDELKQLADYREMQGKAVLDVNGKPTKLTQVTYEFTDPAGVRSNLETIADRMLEQGIHVKVYNASGQSRTLTNTGELDDLEEWLRL
jgi:hypothetical protein